MHDFSKPYLTKSLWNGKPELIARTLFVGCSDGRPSAAAPEFLSEAADAGRPSPLMVPGGPGALVSPHLTSATEEWMWGWISLLHSTNNYNRVIAVAHHDCKYYCNAYPEATPEKRHEIQLVELSGFVRKVSGLILGARIETFFAEPAPCGRTQYRRIQ